MGPWQRFVPGAFSAGAGKAARGICSMRGCQRRARWMRRWKLNLHLAYCDECKIRMENEEEHHGGRDRR